MAVYVDETFKFPGPRGYTNWCHCWADSLAELHALAEAIGLRREWFQDKRDFPHYDLTPSRRVLAVRLGAVPVTWRETVAYHRANRARREAGPNAGVPA